MCVLLEDHALSHLAHDAQEPEFLDLVGIGHDLWDDGLLPVSETRLYRKEKAGAVVRVNEEGELFNDDGNLTDLGATMAEFPLDPQVHLLFHAVSILSDNAV